MTTKTVIIGDVHGCLDELKSLIRNVGVTKQDSVILLGDLLDKGPLGPECVRFARESRFTLIRGNHEDRYLRYRSHEDRVRKQPGYFNPMKKLVGEDARTYHTLSPEDWYYLAAAPLYLEWDDTVLVHGGVKPGVAMSQQQPHHLLNLGGNDKEENHWSYLYTGPKNVIYGHSPTAEDKPRMTHKNGVITFGVDTGCVYGGRLTALVITETDFRFESVKSRGYLSEREKRVA